MHRLAVFALALLPFAVAAQTVDRRQNEADGEPIATVADGKPIATVTDEARKLGLLPKVARCDVATFAEAMRCFTAAAARGDAIATYNLGRIYGNGWGVARDYAQSRQFFEVAAPHYPRAVDALAWLYRRGRGVPKNPLRAIQLFEQAAQNGIPNAFWSLRDIYWNGEGVAKDEVKACQYADAGIQSGERGLLNNLGLCYEKGIGRQKDISKAVALFDEAAANGDVVAMVNAARYYRGSQGVPQNCEKAFDYLGRAMNRGYDIAGFTFGIFLENRWCLPKDMRQEQLDQLYKMLIDAYQDGDRRGISGYTVRIGQLYAKGLGVPRDIAKAKEYFERAGRKGDGEALFSLGLIYRDGLDGFPPDAATANFYLQKALAVGYTRARSFIVAPAASRSVGADGPMLVSDTPNLRRPQTGASVPPGPRLALVIGNSRYAPYFNNLENPGRDATLVAGALLNAGFKVTVKENLDYPGMTTAIANFAAAVATAGPNATALFYYAGHGAASNGTNYLLPTNQQIPNLATLDAFGIKAQDIVEKLGTANPATSIVILDACRNVPFPGTRGGIGGLAEMGAFNGTLIAFSTSPGETATDGSGQNSPYAKALAEVIRQSADPLEVVFRKVRRQVRDLTSNEQTPWESTSLVSDFTFLSR